MYNWDDLRVFLSVARHRSLQHAAEQLSLDATTVGRRLSRLEQSLSCTLVARGRSAPMLTTSGKRLFEAASRIEAATEGVQKAVGETGAGVVRISTSEGFGTAIVAPAIHKLIEKRPRLQIEIVAMPGFLSPAMREVDIAITLAKPEAARVQIERLTDYTLSLYSSPAYMAKHGNPSGIADLRDHRLIGYIDDLLYAKELRYLDDLMPALSPSISSSSIRAQMELVMSGVGIAVLPCFMAQQVPRQLVRVLPTDVSIQRTFWLSVHRDIAQTSRIRAVKRWIHDIVAKARPLLLPG